MTSNLMLHSGGFTATREELANVTVPAKTWTYTPIPHIRIVELLEELIPQRHMKIEKERYALSSEGQRMFGVYDISNGNGSKDWQFALGFRNSYDKSIVVGLVGGSRVFVCDNLAFSGEYSAQHKHTGTIDKDLRFMVGNMLDRFVQGKHDIVDFIAGMKITPMSNPESHDFICTAVRRGVIPTSHVADVLQHWHEPQHKEFEPRNAWSLYNAFTEKAKDRTPGLQLNSTLGLTTMMKEHINS